MVSMITLFLCAGALVSAAPATQEKRAYIIPSENGFPMPDQQQLKNIEQTANGRLSNSPLPEKLSDDSIAAFQLIAFNELFETAYFSSLLNNITNSVEGYEHENRDELTSIISAVLAQEELHALTAISILKNVDAFVPSACLYQFPVTDLNSAIGLAETFTAVVLGALQDATATFAKAAEADPVRAVGAVIGQEGEQNGFYRYLLNRQPPESPFLTTSLGPFAFSALQSFVVPGSCPYSLEEINIPIFPALQLTTKGDLQPEDQTLSFTADLSNYTTGFKDRPLYVTYLTGLQEPISVPISNTQWSDKVISFNAKFPFEENLMYGLTQGALTTSNKFESLADIPTKTLAAPALIQVNQALKRD